MFEFQVAKIMLLLEGNERRLMQAPEHYPINNRLFLSTLNLRSPNSVIPLKLPNRIVLMIHEGSSTRKFDPRSNIT